MKAYCKINLFCRSALAKNNRPAVALLLALVVLIVLTTVVCTLSARLLSRRHRQQYIINYQLARYACDSGMKYALAAIQEMEFDLIERTGEPDFSDLFALNHEQYEQFHGQPIIDKMNLRYLCPALGISL